MIKKAVFFDANILYSWNLNHLFMFFSDTKIGLIEPYWSELVVEEAVRNIKNQTGDDASSRFEQMNKLYPYANVTDFENFIEIEGVHPKDQHVAKAAIKIECDYLVTNNFKHFKNAQILKKKPKVVTADSLLTAFVTKYPSRSAHATALAWWHLKDKMTFDDYLTYLKLKNSGLGLSHFEFVLRTSIENQGMKVDDLAQQILKTESKRY